MPSGRALRTSHVGDTLIVHLARPLRFGDTTRFTLDYHAQIDNGHGLTFIYADGRPHRPQQLWSMGETTGNSAWFPTYDYPNDKESWELIATVPAQMTVVSNGRLMSDVKQPDGTHTTHWREELPSSTYLDLDDRRAVRAHPRSVARHSGRLLRVSRGQRARAPALRLHAGHHRDLHEAHRRALSVGQVRAGDRRRFLRRRGDGERDGARRLAAGHARVRRSPVVPRGCSSRTSSRTSGSATTRPRRTGRISGSTRDSPNS